MSINAKVFKTYLKNKKYSNCIYILHKEITRLLILKVQEFNSNYYYNSLNDLKNQCMKYFNNKEKLIVLAFYDLSFNRIDEMLELDNLFNIYCNLKKR